MGSTLPIPSGSACKVQVSSVAQRRHYPPHFLQPTSRSCTNFFKTYILRDRLDDPPARLDNFATDSRQLRLFTWNVETFISVGKYAKFQEILLTLPHGTYCLQETKSTHSDVLKLLRVCIYLSGTNDDPHAGVGFAIPTPLLPIVYDFHRHCLLSMHPPRYKIHAWTSNGNMSSGSNCAQSSIITNRSSSPFSWGTSIFDSITIRSHRSPDWNHISAPPPFLPDLMPSTNLSFMIDFLEDNELSIVSSMRPRPPSQIFLSGIPPFWHCPNHGLICYIGSCPLSHRTSKALSFHTFSSPCHITLVPSPFPPLREHPATIFSLSQI